jgi:hypothetical protein
LFSGENAQVVGGSLGGGTVQQSPGSGVLSPDFVVVVTLWFSLSLMISSS